MVLFSRLIPCPAFSFQMLVGSFCNISLYPSSVGLVNVGCAVANDQGMAYRKTGS